MPLCNLHGMGLNQEPYELGLVIYLYNQKSTYFCHYISTCLSSSDLDLASHQLNESRESCQRHMKSVKVRRYVLSVVLGERNPIILY